MVRSVRHMRHVAEMPTFVCLLMVRALHHHFRLDSYLCCLGSVFSMPCLPAPASFMLPRFLWVEIRPRDGSPPVV
jgi:hypothetical protein